MELTGQQRLLKEELDKLHRYMKDTWGDYDPGYRGIDLDRVIWVIRCAYEHLTNAVKFRERSDQQYYGLLDRLRNKQIELEKELGECERIIGDAGSDLDVAREAIARAGELEKMIEFLKGCR